MLTGWRLCSPRALRRAASPIICAGMRARQPTGGTGNYHRGTEEREVHGGGEERGGKLTGMVNIAVFAAFQIVCEAGIGARREFKPVCGDGQLDVSCYGWQKRQETAMMWQLMARWAAKTARGGCRCMRRIGGHGDQVGCDGCGMWSTGMAAGGWELMMHAHEILPSRPLPANTIVQLCRNDDARRTYCRILFLFQAKRKAGASCLTRAEVAR